MSLKSAEQWRDEGLGWIAPETLRAVQRDALLHAAELCRKTAALNKNANADWEAVFDSQAVVFEMEAAKLTS